MKRQTVIGRTGISRDTAAIPIPVLATLASLLAGIGTGLGLSFTMNDPWFATVIAFCAVIVVGMVLGAMYYQADLIRYMKIQRM